VIAAVTGSVVRKSPGPRRRPTSTSS